VLSLFSELRPQTRHTPSPWPQIITSPPTTRNKLSRVCSPRVACPAPHAAFSLQVFRLAWRDRVLLAVPVCHHEPALLITLIGMQAADHVDPCLSCSERILQRTARISPGYRVSTALGPRHAALQRHSSQLLQPFDGVRGSPITAHGQGRSRAARWPSLSLLS
jgi:hypothetical protein